MSEYIGKQEAINYCREKQKEIDCERSKALYDCFIEIIKKQPAADVQEVVRCKDCKFRFTPTCFAKHETADGDYCGNGTRMDGDEK